MANPYPALTRAGPFFAQPNQRRSSRNNLFDGAQKSPGRNPELSSFQSRVDLVVHTAHTTAGHSRDPAVLLWPFGHHGLRGDQKSGD